MEKTPDNYWKEYFFCVTKFHSAFSACHSKCIRRRIKDLDVSHGHEAPVVTIVAQAKDNLIISLPQYLKALRSHKLQLEEDGRLNEFSISRVNNS